VLKLLLTRGADPTLSDDDGDGAQYDYMDRAVKTDEAVSRARGRARRPMHA